MDDENDLFLKQMKGVTPIKKNNRILNKKNEIKNKIINKKIKNTKPEELEVKQKGNIKNSNFILENFSIRKSIKKNVLKIDKRVDFHGKSLLEAEDIFKSTITDCFKLNKRCLLFITGKGVFKTDNQNNPNSPKLYHGVIRAEFFNWVKSKHLSRYILSFEKSSIKHGGDGAFYVYLRKNKG